MGVDYGAIGALVDLARRKQEIRDRSPGTALERQEGANRTNLANQSIALDRIRQANLPGLLAAQQGQIEAESYLTREQGGVVRQLADAETGSRRAGAFRDYAQGFASRNESPQVELGTGATRYDDPGSLLGNMFRLSGSTPTAPSRKRNASQSSSNYGKSIYFDDLD